MEKEKVDRIITDYLQKIYGFSVKKSHSYDEAEEICSQIVEQMYISLLRADEIINIEGYIWRISEHTYAKYVSNKKKHEGISLDGIQIPYYDKYSFENNSEEIYRLREEVAFLSQKRRQIVYDFYYKNKSIELISKQLEIPEGTVKWHLNKARNDLKEGFSMERKIGELGLNPIKAISYGHSGNPGNNEGPETYIGDKINLNIVYSVYWEPKTLQQIAEELGLTPVYIEDKVSYLEANGFLVKTTGNKYTTYVNFTPTKYSKETNENHRKAQLKIAEALVKKYVPLIRKAVEDIKDVYIPSGNRELLEAAAIFYAISNKCSISSGKDLSKYDIKTTAGGDFIATIELESKAIDPDFTPTLDLPSYYACGSMTRTSKKYPIYSWSIDTRYDSRKGAWKNNIYTDYEYVYEFIKGMISDTSANSEKFARLKEREFVTDNKVNLMVLKGDAHEFFDKIPSLDEDIKNELVKGALEYATIEAKYYPTQMQDLVIAWTLGGFIGTTVALMVMDILYSDGTFKPLTEKEKITANNILFSDTLPNE
ncbi:MAG: sigma-70 family RNA polymerase sigma factor [Clostridia bacterium]|nr:sigma-70 family RNA polymerase sigma factor [Clostridia bacterium]